MAVALQDQTSIDERIVEDAGLEQALEERERLREQALQARKRYTSADEAAKSRLRMLDLDERPTRCGRFVITQRPVDGRSVSFDTEPTMRLTIRVERRR